MTSTNKEWEKFGKNNPYYGVLTHERFKTENLTESIKEEFFASGDTYVENIFSIIESFMGAEFKPHKSLDFGCGVGRLTIPLSKRSENIIGADVSESVLKEAAKNSELFGIHNAEYKIFTDDLISPNTFNFINTFIVLQHVPVKAGTAIIKKLLNALEENGVAVIHITFSNENQNKVWLFKKLNVLNEKSSVIRFGYKLFGKLFRRRDFSEPVVQMNYYSLNAVFKLMYSLNCILQHNEFTLHGGVIGSLMFIRKNSKSKHNFD